MRGYRIKSGTVEDCHSISVQFLKKYGYLKKDCWSSGGIKWSCNGEETGQVSFQVDTNENYIRFIYKTRDRYSEENWKDKDYRVQLTTTLCHFGGLRYWFVCNYCNKRVGTLHLFGGNEFACRDCLNLTYESRYENRRSHFSVFGRYFDYVKKFENLEANIKRKYYAGRPTKKYRKYLALLNQFEREAPTLKYKLEHCKL